MYLKYNLYRYMLYRDRINRVKKLPITHLAVIYMTSAVINIADFFILELMEVGHR